MQLEVSPRIVDQILILDCAGRMVLSEDESFQDSMKQFISTKNAIVVNLEDVSYMDSGGLGVLVDLQTLVSHRGGKMKLAGLNPVIRDLFRLANLLDVFDVYVSVDQAVMALRKEAVA